MNSSLCRPNEIVNSPVRALSSLLTTLFKERISSWSLAFSPLRRSSYNSSFSSCNILVRCMRAVVTELVGPEEPLAKVEEVAFAFANGETHSVDESSFRARPTMCC